MPSNLYRLLSILGLLSLLATGLTQPSLPAAAAPAAQPVYTAVAAGGAHTCALTAEGAVLCWGSNGYGQLGDGSHTDRSTPAVVAGLSSGVAAIAAGKTGSCALTAGGTVVCWGYWVSSQDGNSATTPQALTGLPANIKGITMGYEHACAFTVGGVAWCWGKNRYGQVGNGTTSATDYSAPAPVVDLPAGVTAISAGFYHTCALASDAAYCWGDNEAGQIGDNSTTNRPRATAVTGLSGGVTAISTGDVHTCAVVNGGAQCWGHNGYFQLGTGIPDGSNKLVPTPVATLSSGVTAVAAGPHHTCALVSGGASKCWGSNEFGELGSGTTDLAASSPQAVINFSGAAALAAGGMPNYSSGAGSYGEFACGVIASGGIKCWGRNLYGQLGDGTTIDRSSPVAVSSLAASSTISGRVVNSQGQGVSGVTVSSPPDRTTVTAADGSYSFSNLTPGSYFIIPSKPGFGFSPASQVVTVSGAPATAPNFTISPVEVDPVWTWMFYLAEDDPAGANDLQGWMPFQFSALRQASKNPLVNVVALADSRDTNTRYMTFTPEGVNSIDNGELSTGAPATLTNFVQWAQQTYPAQHYALIIVDHGQGHTGVAWDNDAPGDTKECPGLTSCLTVKDLRQALTTVAKLDIVNIVACTMGTIETQYQLRGLADFYVASEQIVWSSLNPQWWANGHSEPRDGETVWVPALLAETSPEQLAVAMAQSYYLSVSAPGETYKPGTISVTRLAGIGDLVAKTSALATQLKAEMSGIHDSLYQIGQSVQRFDSNGDYRITPGDEMVDLYDFAGRVETELSGYPAIQTAAADLKVSVQAAIVSSPDYRLQWGGSFSDPDRGAIDWQLGNSHGVSVFFPNYSRSFYSGGWFDFGAGTVWNIESGLSAGQSSAQATGDPIDWGPMLVEYVRNVNPSAPDDPNPPALEAPLLLGITPTVYMPVLVRE